MIICFRSLSAVVEVR